VNLEGGFMIRAWPGEVIDARERPDFSFFVEICARPVEVADAQRVWVSVGRIPSFIVDQSKYAIPRGRGCVNPSSGRHNYRL
jgi:hypothetical protein